jgi:hypothetical protein
MATAIAIATATAVAEPPPMHAPPRADATIRVHPFRFDPDLTVDVPLIRWPDGQALREQLSRVSSPCLLVVGPAQRAPSQWTDLEDWVRDSAPRPEFVTRAVTVARRADLLARPCVDHGRVVRFRGRTVVVPETQSALVRLLVDRFGETVSDADIRALSDEEGSSTHCEAVKTALRRLKDGLAPAGLQLARVRGAGYLLDRAD